MGIVPYMDALPGEACRSSGKGLGIGQDHPARIESLKWLKEEQ